MTIKFEDFITIQPNKKLLNKLNTYNGTLPLYLKILTDNQKHKEYLKEKGTYQKIQKQYHKKRENYKKLTTKEKENYKEKELMEWLKQNPDINKIITEIILKQ